MGLPKELRDAFEKNHGISLDTISQNPDYFSGQSRTNYDGIDAQQADTDNQKILKNW